MNGRTVARYTEGTAQNYPTSVRIPTRVVPPNSSPATPHPILLLLLFLVIVISITNSSCFAFLTGVPKIFGFH
jgi:hypothetical protein